MITIQMNKCVMLLQNEEKKEGKKRKQKNKGDNLKFNLTQFTSGPRVDRDSQEQNKPVFSKTVQRYHCSSINIGKITLNTMNIIFQYLKATGPALKMKFARMILDPLNSSQGRQSCDFGMAEGKTTC